MRAIRSRRVVFPDGVRPASITVHNGRIAAIGPYSAPGQDWGEDAVLPGLVDTHVHINEPGRTEWEGFATATRAAAAGGVTTLLDMPLNCLPPTLDPAALGAKHAAARGKCAVDVGFWGGAVPGNLGRLRELHEAGVFGFKCFLADSGVPEFPALDDERLEQAVREIAEFDGLLIVHAEAQRSLAPMPRSPRFRDFLDSRPARSEVAAVRRLAEAADRYGARVHVLHVSAAEAVEAIAGAKRDGVRITAETCPHYLTLTAESVPDGATEYKCCPPIRDAANRERLWQGLADGTLDIVVSDHSPATPQLKLTGCFGTAWGGIASLQLGLALIWTQAARRGYGLDDVARWMADGPARLAGIRGKGRIAIGHAADLIRFDPEATFAVDPDRLEHRHPVSPYREAVLAGVVRETWLGGQPLSGLADGHLLTRGAD